MPAPLVKYSFFFPFDFFFAFLSKIRCLKMCGLLSGSSIRFHCVFLSVLMSIPGCFQYCNSVVEFEVRGCDASRSSFIAQDCFGYPGFFFAFPNEVEYCSFEVLEEFCWDFAGHCIESVDCFWLNFCFLSFMFERHFYRNENAKH